jgi:(p)ppGpp synthase/HD superfamily hydrolase
VSELVENAHRFAVEAHEGQEKDGAPYIDHLVAVARLVERAGYGDEVVAAALLHDVVEHTDVELEEVRGRFGSGVADLVDAMTEPAEIEPWARRKRAHRDRISRSGPNATAIFAADKVANAASLRLALARNGDVEGADAKVDHYRATLEMVGPTGPVARHLRDELDRLADQRRKRLRVPSSNSHQSG